MKDMGIVHGSAAQAVPLVIGFDTVYVHTDIEPVTADQGGNPVEGLFRYHEIQYPKDEYIRMMAEEQASTRAELENALCEQDAAAEERLAAIEDALCELDKY